MLKFLKYKKFNFTDFFLVCLTIFFFLITPLSEFLNTRFKLPLRDISLAILTIISAFIVIFVFKKKTKTFVFTKFSALKNLGWENYPILISLAAYFFIHTLSFYFYIFIPEWDSYGNLINIKHILASGFTDISYRPLFPMAGSLISSLTSISPYCVFSIIFVALQSSVLLVTYKFLKKYEVKNKFLQLLFLFGVISIPVLSLEIDMTRPQNIFILFFPIYIYFLHEFLAEKKIFALIFSSLIAILGQFYHEFFIFILFFQLLIFVAVGYKKIFYRKLTPRKIIALSAFVTFVMALLPMMTRRLPIIEGIFSILKNAAQRILDMDKWRFWFINNYWNDGELLQMGWPGITGALKYYGYYASPFIFVLIALFLMILVKRNNFSFLKNTLFRITFPFFAVFFAFAEIFPRLNCHYLPERYWIFIGLSIIFMFIPIINEVFEYVKGAKISPRIGLYSIVIFSVLLGMAGIFFLAHGKKSLTSKSEFEAAQWIKSNTPKDAIFITQPANYPMIKYFADREILSPTEIFFLGNEIKKEIEPEKNSTLEKNKNEVIAKIKSDFDDYISGAISLNDFETKLRNNKKMLTGYQETIDKQFPKISGPLYVLYSMDKFNTIYVQREWWRRSNFYGANLEKFDKNLKIIYQNSTVKIWQLR